MDQKGPPLQGEIHREGKESLQVLHLVLLSQRHGLQRCEMAV